MNEAGGPSPTRTLAFLASASFAFVDIRPVGQVVAGGEITAYDRASARLLTVNGATGSIESKLGRAGYRKLTRGERFVVGGAYGPLRDGELDRARAWGAELARAISARADLAAA